mgnify:CR=1 FL=1
MGSNHRFPCRSREITAENAPNVAASINAEYVSKTVGTEIKSE